MDKHRQGQGKAIVLGASVAGLVAARVLGEHFEQVVVLERDPLPGDLQPRKGTPQARQSHGLLAGGLQALEGLFPGLSDELLSRGAERGDLLEETTWHVAGGRHVQFRSGLVGLTVSRPLLEEVIRRRVAALANVSIRDQMSVERLLPDATRHRILGVELNDRGRDRRESLFADLIVDATGRGSRMPQWLADMGFPRPQEDRVEVNLAYATQLFRRRPGDFDGQMATIITPDAPRKRFAVALAIEENRWSVTLGGMFGDHPPTDEPGLREFASQLPTQTMYDFIRHAEPLSEVSVYRVPGSQRRRYERLRRFPEGLLVMGDALCSFNPIYGQGMTIAALEAAALSGLLSVGRTDLARRFFAQAARLVDVPWQIAVTTDFQHRETTGRKPWLADLLNAYLRRVHQAAHTDPAVALAFHRVANLLDKPARLTRPSIAARVLKHCWRGDSTDGTAAWPACAATQ
jgi:2-polyprenyl-6-methoxyphenol hydroxylase-like FAD-dependent oxidoreductase